tara:strand:+ start:5013 stop:5291 length:279 start_codon:yes stop_codon:yes gene_type:complete
MEWILYTTLPVILISTYIIVNMLRKHDKLEDIVLEQEDIIINLYKRFDDAYTQMKSADQKGGFESDDEIGQVFSQLKGIIEDLKNDLEKKDE